jgi:hypothetical protein
MGLFILKNADVEQKNALLIFFKIEHLAWYLIQGYFHIFLYIKKIYKNPQLLLESLLHN